MPDYLVRLAHIHESFRKAELQALAELHDIDIKFIIYEEESPFCILSLPDAKCATTLITRSILSQSVYELWGLGNDYASLHASVRSISSSRWPAYSTSSFRFALDSFRGSRSTTQRREIIESFSFLPFDGPIRMRNPELDLRIFEDYELHALEPKKLYLGRFIAASGRQAKITYDLKKRHYISTTSMDAELALVTANMALAAPGKLFYDPFTGTGGFPIACAHFGAMVCGSDIDGRSIRGKDARDVQGNFKQYKLESLYLDSFISDLTNSPIRGCISLSPPNCKGGWLDGIVCDPPYGVREGLKVLGNREGSGDWKRQVGIDRYKSVRIIPPHRIKELIEKREDGYIPPKRPYSFEAMLDDILEFASQMLLVGGRLSMWMPTANDEDIELRIPSHPCLETVSVCVQPFNKWSRRLLTYQRLPDSEVKDYASGKVKRDYGIGVSADDLNNFRKKYFQGFKGNE